MLPNDVKIIRQTEDASFADGKTTRVIKVYFKVGDHGPFTASFPKDGFTADNRDTTIAQLATEYRVQS